MHQEQRVIADLAFAADEYYREKEYWLSRLSGEWEKSHFPYDFDQWTKNKSANDYNTNETIQFAFPETLNSRLIQACNNSDYRLLMILTACLILLLNKYTGQQDIIIGTPIDRQEMESNFINTILILRNQVAKGTRFKELLFQVRHTLVVAGENQNYPLETLSYDLNIPESESGFSLFDTAIIVQNIQEKKYISHIPLSMFFIFTRKGTIIEGKLEYNNLLFQPITVERIISHFICLLKNSLDHADKPIEELDMMEENEKRRILIEFNNTEYNNPNDITILKLFHDQVIKTPENIATIEKKSGRNFSYRQLNNKINQLSHRLINKVRTNSVVAIMGERKVEIVVAIISVLKVGGTYLPIDALNPDDRIKFFFEDSGSVALLTEKSTWEKHKEPINHFNNEDILLLDDKNVYTDLISEPSRQVKPNTNAYLIYTSGTTGKPKGVLIKHFSLLNYISWAIRQYVKNESLNFPFYTSIAFDLTITSIFTPLVTGNAVIIYGGWEKDVLIERIFDDKQVGIIKITPSHLKLIRDKKIINDSIKKLIIGGEELDAELAKEISSNFKNGVELFNEYGPTETTVGCMIYRFDQNRSYWHTVPVGNPAANTQIYLLDENRNPVPWGALGIIYISGNGVAEGYLNRPELTREKFIPDPFIPNKTMYCSGDIARMLSDGNIQFLGRTDFQVKIRGFRIELGEIESKLRQIKGIREVILILKEDKTHDKFLCAYMVLESISPTNSNLKTSQLKKRLLRELPDYMIPRYFIEIPNIPLTQNGKLDKKALPEPQLDFNASYSPPGNKIEQNMVEIWGDTLGLDSNKIGIDANYFEIGGHSLRATALAARIHKEFDVRVQLADIFQRPTVRELAKFVKHSIKELFVPIVSVEKKDYYSVSSAQKRLYVLQLMEKNNIGYNMPFVTILEGDVNVNNLEQSFQKLVQRHESFRTQFKILKEEPVQIIVQREEIEFQLDFRKLPQNEINTFLKNYIRPFDLSKAPLLRVLLIQTDTQNIVLHIDMHHIISDGLSMDIFIKEFIHLYGQGELPELYLQYKDFSEWQNNERQKIILNRQEKYWIKELKTDIPIINLPYDKQRPPIKTFEGNTIPLILNSVISKNLKDLVFKQDVTQFMVLFTCFSILIYKISNQDDIIIGTPVAGRKHADLDNTIGVFINSLALRCKIIPEYKFSTFLHYIKEKTLECFENQDYPFEDLVEKTALKRDTSRNPLYDIMFTYYSNEQDYNVSGEEESSFQSPGFRLKKFDYDYPISKLDMTLHAIEKNDHYVFLFEYCTRIFEKETIERFSKYLSKLIQLVVEEPDIQLSQINILPDEEKNIILHTFNNTGREYPYDKTIHILFEDQVKRTPNYIALLGHYSSHKSPQLNQAFLSYGELNRKSNQLALILGKKGIKSDTVVGIMGERLLETIIGIMGILKAGGAYMPIASEYPQERIQFMLKDSNCSFLLTNSEIKSLCSFPTSNSYPLNNSQEIHSPMPPYHSLAYIIYTSGSTGKPKGVMIQHGSVINRLHWMQRCYPISEGDVILQKTPMVFDVSVWELFWWGFQGARLCLLEPGGEKNPSIIINTISKNYITTLHFVPSMLTAFLEHLEKSLGLPESTQLLKSLSQVFSSGESLMPYQVAKFNKLIGKSNCTKLINLYGPTEATVDVTYYNCPNDEDVPEIIPIGMLIDNIQLYILDKNHFLQPIGIPGELSIAGDGVGRGYLNRPELTDERFIPPFKEPNLYQYRMESHNTHSCIYKTGDLARWYSNGNIEFLGRIDRQVKIRGFRIELEEIESQMMTITDVMEAVVKSYKKQDGQDYLCGYFTAYREITNQEIINSLQRNLPYYMIPSFFVQLSSFPQSPSGKIDRKQLKEPELKLKTVIQLPQNENEKIIHKLWSDILPVQTIDIDDTFFSIGGNSIDVIKVAARMTEIFERDIPPLVLFEYPTIRSLSKFLTYDSNKPKVLQTETNNKMNNRNDSLEEAVQLFEEI